VKLFGFFCEDPENGQEKRETEDGNHPEIEQK